MNEMQPVNAPECTILGSWVFDSFITGHKLFAKALQSLKTFLLVSINLLENYCQNTITNHIWWKI